MCIWFCTTKCLMLRIRTKAFCSLMQEQEQQDSIDLKFRYTIYLLYNLDELTQRYSLNKVPPKLKCYQCDSINKLGLGEVIRPQTILFTSRIKAFIEEVSASLSFCLLPYKGGGVSPQTWIPTPWFWTSWSPKLWKNKISALYVLPSFEHSVIATALYSHSKLYSYLLQTPQQHKKIHLLYKFTVKVKCVQRSIW